MSEILRIAVTPGEPAGIGPDLVVQLAAQSRAAELVVIGDPELLRERAQLLGADLRLLPYEASRAPAPGKAGELLVEAVKLAEPCIAGKLNAANGPYVLSTLDRATRGCLSGEFQAMLTAPVQKSVINESGTAFSGHTEYLAEICGVETPVMLLCAEELRVALLTTHLALRDVPDQITARRIETVGKILDSGLKQLFGLDHPRIAILGLNPHSGEAGQLGREEIEVIEPAVRRLQTEGIDAHGPIPADSAFTPASLKQFDAVLAMYHDQGLPVLKHRGFGGAVNITLGLPIVRTSVDHGTALQLAGTGKADAGSLRVALRYAEELAKRFTA